MGFGLSQQEVAKSVGKSRSAIANTLRLLSLPELALDALQEGKITAGHARAILAQESEDQAWALKQILDFDLSVRQAEQLVVQKSVAKEKGRARSSSDGRYASLQEDLARHVGTKVKVSGGSKGKLELFFYSTDELDRLLELMGYQP